jgi:Carboxypeptidase regulatory-like domain
LTQCVIAGCQRAPFRRILSLGMVAARLRLAAALALLAMAPAAARAEEPWALLIGRVFERGGNSPVAGARVQAASGTVATTDGEGRFQAVLAPGEVELVIERQGFQPLRVKERMEARRGVEVEYYLARSERFHTTVVGEQRHEGGRFALESQELARLPGNAGDPLHTLALLPGVGTPYPLLPVYVVRGASPGSTGFFLDGMRIPQLFHLLISGGSVNPLLVDRLEFYPGAFDASLGRYSGGVVEADTRPARPEAVHAAVDARLYDASALAEAALPRGVGVVAAFHYGYPDAMLHLFAPQLSLTYWDYQARLDAGGLTVEGLGSFDEFSVDRSKPFRLTWHRAQVRGRGRRGAAEYEAALVGGFDEMSTFSGAGVRKLSLGARALVRARLGSLSIATGADVELARFWTEDFLMLQESSPLFDELGELATPRVGLVGGAFVEGTWEIRRGLAANAGARVDAYTADGVTVVGIDPRLSVRARLLPQLSVAVAGGLYQQPPSFPVALPAIDTFALRLGLQRAWQGSTTIEAQLPAGFTLSTTGYYARLINTTDIVLAGEPPACAAPPPESQGGFLAKILRTVNGESFGLEVLLRRQKGRVTGWIAYTLSRSERYLPCGIRPSDWDQTHLLNAVVQVQLPWRLVAGARVLYSTGLPISHPDAYGIRNNARLPDYFQLDLRLDREWVWRRLTIAAFLEVLNTTYSAAVLGLVYPQGDKVDSSMPEAQKTFRWLGPSIGLRGAF